jgi:hypothetical protein
VTINARTVEIAKQFPIEGVIDGRGIKLRGKIERVGPLAASHFVKRSSP